MMARSSGILCAVLLLCCLLQAQPSISPSMHATLIRRAGDPTCASPALEQTAVGMRTHTCKHAGQTSDRRGCDGSYSPALDGVMRIRGGGLLPYSSNVKIDMSNTERKEVARLKVLLAEDLRRVAKTSPELAMDDRLLRFLRCYKLDVERTVLEYRKMLEWRRVEGPDEVREQVLKHYHDDFWQMKCIPHREYYRNSYLFNPQHAVLANGDLVSVECVGQVDIRKFMSELTEVQLLNFWYFLMEWTMIKLAKLSRKHGRIVRMVQIKDMQGLSMWQATCKKGMERFGKINKMLHTVYPETLAKLIIINVPPVFGVIWQIFRPLLPARTVKKIDIWASEGDVRDGLTQLLGPDDAVVGPASGVPLFEEQLSISGGSASRKWESLISRIASGGLVALALMHPALGGVGVKVLEMLMVSQVGGSMGESKEVIKESAFSGEIYHSAGFN